MAPWLEPGECVGNGRQKTRLDAALTRFAKPKAFEDLRSALGKGQRLTTTAIKTPVAKPAVKPKPAKKR